MYVCVCVHSCVHAGVHLLVQKHTCACVFNVLAGVRSRSVVGSVRKINKYQSGVKSALSTKPTSGNERPQQHSTISAIVQYPYFCALIPTPQTAHRKHIHPFTKSAHTSMVSNCPSNVGARTYTKTLPRQCTTTSDCIRVNTSSSSSTVTVACCTNSKTTPR